MTVCTVTTRRGVTYSVKQISDTPRLFVSFIKSPVEDGPLHRDGRTLDECMRNIGLSVSAAEAACQQIETLFTGGR